MDKLADQVFHVAADVAGLAEFGGVCLDKGDADQVRNVPDEVGLADASGTNQDNVLLYRSRLASSAASEAAYWA